MRSRRLVSSDHRLTRNLAAWKQELYVRSLRLVSSDNHRLTRNLAAWKQELYEKSQIGKARIIQD
jgi:hypothetical protein